VGIDSKIYRLPSNVVEADVQTIVEQLSSDIHVDGILVQLPLPAGLKEEIILQDISIVKDVDGGLPLCRMRLQACQLFCCMLCGHVAALQHAEHMCCACTGLSPINVG